MNDRDLNTLLRLFGLEKNFSLSELKQAYRDLVQVWHPDKYLHNTRLKAKAEEKLKEINGAYKILAVYCAGREGSTGNNHADSSFVRDMANQWTPAASGALTVER